MGPNNNTKKKKPSHAAQRLADLGTEAVAGGHEDVAQVIFLVKGDQEHPDNIKNLKKDAGAKRSHLEKTYAYLIGSKVEEEEVVRLNVEGLREMILHQLNILMPQQCKKYFQCLFLD